MNLKHIMLATLLPLPLIAIAGTTMNTTNTPKENPMQSSLRKQYESKIDFRFDQPYAGNTNPRQMLDVYLPKNRTSTNPVPVIVYFHGGGWIGGDRLNYGGSRAATQVSSGNYAAVSVGYRLSNEAKWPAQIFDCKAAIRWIRGHAKEFNLDPDRIAVSGSSAGGHLVAMLGLTAGVKELEGNLGEFTNLSSAVTCVVNLCGPTDLASPINNVITNVIYGLLGGNAKDKPEAAKSASPITFVSKDAAPFLTVQGTKDVVVDLANAVNLDTALKQAGASSLLIKVIDGGHHFNGGPELDKRIQQFLDLHLRGVKTEISTAPIQCLNAKPAP